MLQAQTSLQITPLHLRSDPKSIVLILIGAENKSEWFVGGEKEKKAERRKCV